MRPGQLKNVADFSGEQRLNHLKCVSRGAAWQFFFAEEI